MVTSEELSAARSRAGKIGAAHSPASRPKPDKIQYQATNIRRDTLHRLRAASDVRGVGMSQTIEDGLDALADKEGRDF